MSIILSSVGYIHPDREILFDNLNLSLQSGQKAAVVGNNGAGKSTLLRLITGAIKPTSGQLSVAGNIYFVPQHLGQFDALTIAELLGVQPKLDALHAILNGDSSEHHFVILGEDWDIDERVTEALSAWHLGYFEPSQKIGFLSGGEKTKVHLAGVTLHQPDIILLDEPTNHLDVGARNQLYSFLHSATATTLIASHDRTLLNVVDQILEIGQSGIEVYGGNYNFYEEQKNLQVSALESRLQEHKKTLKKTKERGRELATQRQKQEIRGKSAGKSGSDPRIIVGGRKARAEESTARLADAQANRAAKITNDIALLISEIRNHLVLKTEFHASHTSSGKALFEAKDLNFQFANVNLWEQSLNFFIRPGDRVRIEGANGAGKTTLLQILAGNLHAGETLSRSSFQHLYLDQEYSIIDNTLSILEQVQRYNDRHLAEHEVKTLLHQHQFPSALWDRKCANLSGGEKMKLTLCCLAASEQLPDLLMLDEPTNNLDLESQKVLVYALKNFTGALIAISHDPWFWKEIGIDIVIRL
jgi:ATPase subunit of ABC transporter with duplicated ATPase domains